MTEKPRTQPPARQSKGDVAEAGQEEVFSRTAIEHGLIKDPKALDPAEAARARPARPT